MDRRAFLATLAAGLAPRPGWAELGSPAFLAAAQAGDAYVLHGLSATGESLFHLPLPARGHAAAAHPARAEAVAFARRPGIFALVLDCGTGAVIHRLSPPAGMQFNGHGAYSGDGSVLMTSEVVADTSEGRIGLWETKGYTRLTDWPSHGIGPHEVLRLPDDRLAVANGGIRTDPVDRTKLNLDSMRPNLALLSPDGALLDRIELPDLPQNSIRHLALAGPAIAFAMQWEGDPSEPVQPLGLWTPGQTPVLCALPPDEALAMQGYAGSVAATDRQILVTSPRGGVAMLFDAAGDHLATHRRADLCGAAARDGRLVVTDGLGALWSAETAGLLPLATHPLRWDNHLIALVSRA
jgi:hypothetical protein